MKDFEVFHTIVNPDTNRLEVTRTVVCADNGYDAVDVAYTLVRDAGIMHPYIAMHPYVCNMRSSTLPQSPFTDCEVYVCVFSGAALMVIRVDVHSDDLTAATHDALARMDLVGFKVQESVHPYSMPAL